MSESRESPAATRDTDLRDRLFKDYDATTAYFRALLDVRFKLLAFLPLFTGGGWLLLKRQESEPRDRLVLALLGLLVTIGLTIYDWRNTKIYDALKIRAKSLEVMLHLPVLEKENRDRAWKFGGAFLDRPRDRRLSSHTIGLALIYGAVTGSWVYFVVDAVRGLWPRCWCFDLPLSLAIVAFLVVFLARNRGRPDDVEDDLRQSIRDLLTGRRSTG